MLPQKVSEVRVDKNLIEWPDSLDLMQKLTPKQVRTAERYLIHFDLNRAVQEVYEYDNPVHSGLYPQVAYNTASRLRADEDFVTYLAARFNETSMPADRVLREFAKIAGSSIEDFMNDEMLEIGKPMFDLSKARRLGVLGCIKRIVFLDKGGIQVELYDKLRALEDLAKHYNLLRENEVQIDNYVITIVRADEVIEVKE